MAWGEAAAAPSKPASLLGYRGKFTIAMRSTKVRGHRGIPAHNPELDGVVFVRARCGGRAALC
jgi:hypothetical protein